MRFLWFADGDGDDKKESINEHLGQFWLKWYSNFLFKCFLLRTLGADKRPVTPNICKNVKCLICHINASLSKIYQMTIGFWFWWFRDSKRSVSNGQITFQTICFCTLMCFCTLPFRLHLYYRAVSMRNEDCRFFWRNYDPVHCSASSACISVFLFCICI